MRIALLSDIHANIYALEAVLLDAQHRSLDRYAVLGDIIYFGLYPRETLERLETLDPLVFIKGNTDANIEDLTDIVVTSTFESYLFDVATFTYQALSEDQRQRIQRSPIALETIIEKRRMLFCHGSPYSFTDSLLPDGECAGELAEKIARERAELILCGHTHIPGDFVVSDHRVINPGGIGYSFNGDTRAHYAILDIQEKHIEVEFHQVVWDTHRYQRELSQVLNQFPLFESIIYALSNGKPMNNFRKRFSRKT
ncbi:MAG: metallophosphoesterase family protein [Sphaerochaetaceae bacterium]|nr:metallophosphoesterase family protein [Sphaerochaetaceae bacterium]